MNDRAYNQIQTKQMEVVKESVNQYNIAYDIVNKTYLNKVNALDIVPFQESGFESRNSMNFSLLEITRIVHGDRKSALENLMNILSTLHPDYGSILVIKSDGIDTHFYIGVRAYNQAKPASSGIKLLMQAMDGSFPGTDYEKLRGEKPDQVLSQADFINCFPDWAIGTAPLVPDLKHENYDQFTQGLERFIDAMYGKKYTAMIIAEPMQNDQLVSLQNGYEGMATALSVYQKAQISTSINESQALSESISKGFTDTLSQSVTLSQSYTDGKSTSESNTKGKSSNRAAVLAGLGALVGSLGGPLGALIGGGIGGVIGGAIGEKNESSSNSYSTNESKTHGDSKQYGSSKSESQTETTGSTDTFGRSDTFSIEQRNKGIERLIGKIDQQLKRIDASKSYGIWNASFYVVAENTESAHIACSLFKGILKGKESAIEDSAIAIWNSKTDNKQTALEYFTNIVHPRLNMNMNRNETPVIVTPSSVLSGKELALLMNFPRKSVSGLTVIDAVNFGREPHILDIIPNGTNSNMKEWIKLGIVRNLFRDFDQKKVLINPDKMVYHTLVTGTTGVGKTNSIKVIVSEMVKNHIPFLVIEPAKNEYCELIGLSHIENRVRYFQAGKSRDGKSNDTCLRINPFIFPQSSNISINEHIDKICALFNSAFPMYDAMPHILEEAIIKAYLNCGWDMETSCNIRNVITFPTLLDVAELIPNIVKQAGYEYEVKSTYIGALTTRLKSLTRGSLGFTFLATPDQETPERELFDESCIVNLSSIGSSEKKSILMGLILIRLCEHSMTHQQTEYDHLKHLMILEEAHHLLKKVSKDQSQESSNPQGQAVEYLSNMLAEMRSYGQGMLIVDQSPSALDESVLRNTNIKISFRAPFEEDRKIIGGALNLDDKQTKALASLENHTALVKQNNWLEPILCHFDKFDKSQLATNQSDELSPNKDRIALTEVLFLLLHERFPKNAKIPEMEISNKELGNWVEETIPELDNKKLILEYLITHVADLELEQMIPVLFALPLIKSIVEEAFNLLQTPESIINNLQAKVKICTWFDDPLILQEIAHTLLMACRTQKAETVDDVLLGTKEKEEI